MYIIVAILSLVTAFSIFSARAKSMALYGLVIFYLGIDYSNYLFQLGDSLAGTLAKSYKEMLLLALLLMVSYSAARRRVLDSDVLVLLLVSSMLLLYGGTQNGFFLAAVDWRDSVLPVVTAALLAACGLLEERKLERLLMLFATLIAANSLLAVFQYYSFSGDYESIWRYDFLLQESLRADSSFEDRMVEYQIVRAGELRSSGLFASALQYSYSAALCCFYFYCIAWSRLSKTRLLAAVLPLTLMAVCAMGVYVSQVRASLMIVVVSIAIHFFAFGGISGKQRVGRALFIGFGCVAAFLVAIIFFFNSFDSSVQGRVPQYALLIQEFRFFGHGVGAFRGRFDSYYVYGMLTFGVLFPIWIIWVINLYRRSFPSRRVGARQSGNVVIQGFIFASIIPALVIACFQHFSASLYYQMIWLMLFSAVRAARGRRSSALHSVAGQSEEMSAGNMLLNKAERGLR
ncbi:hypothetical protein ABRP17_001280 [Stenotrophomonas sp. WHRI 8082]|uniref:hypothetical protein n=1 Tax=Stenotrophomonas sp. WHRI 8082 TaxID=3162571 RepID=UPI0032EECD79